MLRGLLPHQGFLQKILELSPVCLYEDDVRPVKKDRGNPTARNRLRRAEGWLVRIDGMDMSPCLSRAPML